MGVKIYHVHTIGSKAQSLLAQPQEAWVMGVTSSGLFLRLSSDWIVFLSKEPFHGPLTLNLARPLDENLLPGSLAMIGPATISLPEAGVTFQFSKAASWQPLPPEKELNSASQRLFQLDCLARQVFAVRGNDEIRDLLSILLNSEPESVRTYKAISAGFQVLRVAVRERQPAGTAQAMEELLGQGTGLTPFGDDLLCGFLLALSRWGDLLAPGFSLATIEQAILPVAYRQTTLLSANLIECAANGLADERLILALDGVVTGTPACETCAERLLAWGNSSGLAALCGMAVVIA